MSKLNDLNRGVIVALILAALTGVEYLVGTRLSQAVILLVAFALLKGGLVVWYFMHVARVFRAGPGASE